MGQHLGCQSRAFQTMTEASLFGSETGWERDGSFDQDQHWSNCARGDPGDPGDHPDLAQLLRLQDATLRAVHTDESKFLRNYRTEMFLLDDHAPLAISAQSLLLPKDKERALAELDGMLAGFKLLDKIHASPYPLNIGGPGQAFQDWDDEDLCDVGSGQLLPGHQRRQLE